MRAAMAPLSRRTVRAVKLALLILTLAIGWRLLPPRASMKAWLVEAAMRFMG